ncbi:MAG: phosphatase [Halioglobus sp.]|nr:phosphatase [Halioglobus sp.]
MGSTYNTLRTTMIWLGRLTSQWLPFTPGGNTLEGIYNYVPISERMTTSGQPTEHELELISRAGYSTVINLAPTSKIENSVVNEAEVLTREGVNYVHIPVRFDAPAQQHFDRFVTALEQSANEKVWVHCAANMRVSAFVYRYRCEVLREDPTVAREDLHRVWNPPGVWKKFIAGQGR